MPQETLIIVLGATSMCGKFLLRRLAQAGWTGIATSRGAFDAPEGFTAQRLDPNAHGDWLASEGAVVLSLLPIWALVPLLPRLERARALIATSSTSLYGKANSKDAEERAVADRLAKAESAFRIWAETRGACWTILRPTLVYDCLADRNVTRVAAFIKRWRCLPIAKPADGLRQPIHADDVAMAMMKAIDNPAAVNKAFNISGGEILTYRAMAERIFVAMDLTPRFVPLPAQGLRQALWLPSRLGVMKDNGSLAAMFQRMNEHLVFESEQGLLALDYTPRPFAPTFALKEKEASQ